LWQEWKFASKEKAMPLHPRLTNHRQALRPAQIAARRRAMEKEMKKQMSWLHRLLLALATGVALILMSLILIILIISGDIFVLGGRLFGR
jgi:lipopolysaccharide/colanic/teichoic acid biosynthesis glycosyltransferase